jgi:hypothetical protein
VVHAGGDVTDDLHKEHLYPSSAQDAEHEMVINLTGAEMRIYVPWYPTAHGGIVERLYRTRIATPSSDPLKHELTIGADFRPGRAVRLLGVPATELTHQLGHAENH